MQGVVNIGLNAKDIQKSELQNPYSRVTIIVSEEKEFTAGDDTGETLEITCPWGTQAMANNILSKVRGFQYQPLDVSEAITNPALELGDGVFANNIRSGVYQQDITFGQTMYHDISAPQEEQLDKEFTYTSPIERRITREAANTKAELKLLDDAIKLEVTERTSEGANLQSQLNTQSTQISAKVSQTGGKSSTFGWTLASSKFELYSGSKQVFLCNSSGIKVDGQIVAKSGIIGAKSDGTGGFTIKANYLCTNAKPSYNDTTISGVFVGTTGIGLGKGTFTVSAAGKLTASDATLTGAITAKSGKIGAKSDGTGGFDIKANYIASGKTSYNETTNNGVYIGTSGIGLGKGVFTVSNAGKLTASNADIKGKITATSGSFTGSITCESIRFNSGVTISGSNITDGTVGNSKISDVGGDKVGSGIKGSNINNGSVTKGKTSSNVQTSLDNGDTALSSFNSLITGSLTATWIKTSSLNTDTLRVKKSGAYQIASWQSTTINGTTIEYLGH